MWFYFVPWNSLFHIQSVTSDQGVIPFVAFDFTKGYFAPFLASGEIGRVTAISHFFAHSAWLLLSILSCTWREHCQTVAAEPTFQTTSRVTLWGPEIISRGWGSSSESRDPSPNGQD